MDATKLKIWLPFDKSATADKCGNSWTTYGTTSIDDTNAINSNALQLNKGYLRSNSPVEFGGSDFTVDFYGYMNSSSEQWAGFFCAQSTTNTLNSSRRGQIAFHRNNTANTLIFDCYNANGSKLCDVTLSNTNWLNGRHHFELDYSHANSTLKIFIDGGLSLTQTITLERLSRYIFLGVNSYDPPVQRMVGTIDEFRLFDGVILHTSDFIPPTAVDYEDLAFQLNGGTVFTADVERVIKNSRLLISALKAWLPFDESATLDRCKNSWTAYGSPTISTTNAINGKALQLDGLSYLQATNIELGGKDFTICGYCYTSANCAGGARVFNVHLPPDTGTALVQLRHPYGDSSKWRLGANSAANSSSTSLNITDFQPYGRTSPFRGSLSVRRKNYDFLYRRCTKSSANKLPSIHATKIYYRHR